MVLLSPIVTKGKQDIRGHSRLGYYFWDKGLKDSQYMGTFRVFLIITKKMYIPLPEGLLPYLKSLNCLDWPTPPVLVFQRSLLCRLSFHNFLLALFQSFPPTFNLKSWSPSLQSPFCLLPSNLYSFKSFNHEDSHSISHWQGSIDIDKGE